MSNYRDDVREMLKKFKTNNTSTESKESTPVDSSPGIEPVTLEEEVTESEVTSKPPLTKNSENSAKQVRESAFLQKLQADQYRVSNKNCSHLEQDFEAKKCLIFLHQCST